MIAGLPFSKALSSVALTILLFLALPDLIQSGLTIWQKYRAFFAVSGLLVFYLISVGYSDQLTNALKFCYQQNILLTLPLIWVAHRERLLPHLTGFLKVFIYACGFTSVVTLLLFGQRITSAFDCIDFCVSNWHQRQTDQTYHQHLAEAEHPCDPSIDQIQHSKFNTRRPELQSRSLDQCLPSE